MSDIRSHFGDDSTGRAARALKSGRRPWSTVVGFGSVTLAAVLVLVLWNPRPKAEKPADDLVLYCAAGMAQPVEEICRQYEQEYGVRVSVDPAGSGELLARMAAAADRGDLFLAADSSYIDKALSKGLIAETLPVVHFHPVIIVQKGNPKGVKTVEDLLNPEIKVALANPDIASIGRVCKTALGPGGLWDKIEVQSREQQAKVSFLKTVNEVVLAVHTQAADAGIVWDSNAQQDAEHVDWIESPFLKDRDETATLAVIAKSKQPTRALHLARYLTAKDKGESVFKRFHYQTLDDADEWADTPKVTLFTGAMLRPAVEEVVANFKQREGVEINWTYAGCGLLVTSIEAGSPVDAYFSCDTSYLDKVQDRFLPPVLVSKNDLVMIVAKDNPHGIARLADLAKPELKIGLADPEKAALGYLTHELLRRQGLDDRVQSVVDADAGHTLVAQLAAGALDAAIVYRSNALATPETARDKLKVIEIDVPHDPAVQPYAIARDGQHKYLMQRLLAAIRSAQSQKHFEDVGFQWLASKSR